MCMCLNQIHSRKTTPKISFVAIFVDKNFTCKIQILSRTSFKVKHSHATCLWCAIKFFGRVEKDSRQIKEDEKEEKATM